MNPLRFWQSFSLERHMEAKNVPFVDEKFFPKDFHQPNSKIDCTKDLSSPFMVFTCVGLVVGLVVGFFDLSLTINTDFPNTDIIFQHTFH